MPPTRRKRKKIAEKLSLDQSERNTKIKTEPEDDLPATGICCLCKASSGVNLFALFEDGSKRADPTTVEKIKICIGREMKVETDPAAKICCMCLQELDMHHGFWKQAMQCNDYAQNQMAADEAEVVDAPTEIRVCRFCLKIGGKLLDLFSEGGAPKELGEIRECLAVQMNSSDPVTKICRNCIQRIQNFLTFQTKHVPVSKFSQQEITAGSSHPPNGILRKQTKSKSLDRNVSDSDCSAEDENKRKDPLTRRTKAKPEVIRPEIVALLGADLKGRNFDVVFENGEQLKVAFEGYQFRFHSKSRSGSSLWSCLEAKLHKCLVKLEIEPTGKSATIASKCSTHGHPALAPKITECPVVKRTFQTIQTDEVLKGCYIDKPAKEQKKRTVEPVLKERTPEIFKVLQENDPERNFECVNAGSKLKTRKEGFEYRYYATQEDESTLWKCIMDSLHHCRIIAKISGDGKKLEIFKGVRHSHTAEPAPVFSYPLGKRMVGDEPLWILKRVSMYYESRYLIYRNYVHILLDVNQKGVTRWGCLRKQHCRASVTVKQDFKELFFSKDHSHESPPQETLTRLIEGRQDPSLSPDENLTTKQRLLSFTTMTGTIWDEVRNERETFYFLKKAGRYSLIFRGFRYAFASIDQFGTSRWSCIKLEECRRVIVVMEGVYESIYIKGEHAHEMMTDSEIDLAIQRSMYNTLTDAAEGSSLMQLSANDNEPSNALALLARQDPNRNFSVGRKKLKLIIRFDEHDFRLNSLESDGTSLWVCIWILLRRCPFVLRLSADGKQVTAVDPKKKHTHSEEQIAIFFLACGKASVYDKYIGAYRFYWLFSFETDYRQNRGIIYQGFKYYLQVIGRKGMSSWQCRVYHCRAFVRVEDCLKVIICKNNHTHDPLSSEEILAITGSTEVDKDLLQDTDTVGNEGPLRPLTLLQILSTNDSDRNFQVSIDKEDMKIFHNGYEYSHYSSNATHSVWKCIYSFVSRCRAVFHVENHCRQGSHPKIPRHNHSTEVWDIFRYPLGKYSIMDSHTETMKPLWYLRQPGFLRSYPMLIYDQNKFTLIFVNESRTKWRCSGQHCMVIVTVTGLFELISGSGSPHHHDPPTEEKIARWIRLYGGDTANGETHEGDGECDDQIPFVPFVEVPMDNDGTLKFEEL